MDDGLLLNLATGDVPGTRKPKAQNGGSWRERHRAKKAAQRREIKANPELKNAKVAKPRPQRKEKEKTETKAQNVENTHGIKRIKQSDKTKSGQETFVSSLFTSNPEYEAAEEQELIPQAASNAPLADSTDFMGLGLNNSVCRQLTEKLGLERPTRIQRAVVPRLLGRDKDLLIQAETGSGKTLAYVLPMIEKLMSVKMDRHSGLFGVIIAPTRELVSQIFAVLEKIVGCCHWIVPGIVIGGEKKKSEKQRIRKGVNLLVGTPGRLADHFDNTEALDVSQVRWVVMDEGDMLMELGFEETINKILDKIEAKSRIEESELVALPKRRINVLCSATMKNNVQRLSQRSLSSFADTVTPQTVGGGGDDESEMPEASIAPAQLVQNCIVVPAKLRLVTLAAMLKNLVTQNPQCRVIVFFSCADSVEFNYEVFTRDGDSIDEDDKGKTAPDLGDHVSLYKVHGSLDQPVRRATVAAFKKPHTTASILFATDLLSRGLDLPMVSNVVEYDPPSESEEHLHRVGRTARAGAAGSANIFLLPGSEEQYVDVLKPLHPNGIHNESYKRVIGEAFGKNWEIDATTWHLNVERWLLQDEEQLGKARNAFKSHVRAYMTHIANERHIFDRKGLHLGHLAKSFALRETPGQGTNSTVKKKKEKDPKKRQLAMARKHAANYAAADEFNLG